MLIGKGVIGYGAYWRVSYTDASMFYGKGLTVWYFHAGTDERKMTT